MNHLFTFIICFVFTSQICGQAPGWQNAYRTGGCYPDGADAMCTDAFGNLYITGRFGSDSIKFGQTTLYNVNPGPADMFVVKYDQQHNVVWAKSAGGTFYEKPFAIDTDAEGCVYVSGSFWSDTVAFGNDTLTGGENYDFFVVKYDPNGNALWARGAGGPRGEQGNGIAWDASGSVYVCGYFSSHFTTFGNITLQNTDQDQFSDQEMFVVKYDPSGNALWAVKSSGTDHEWAFTIALDSAGNVYTAGWFYSDTMTLGPYTLINNGYTNMFIAKIDPSGNVLWAKSAGGTQVDLLHSLVYDPSGYIYATGFTGSPSITFDSHTFVNSNPGNGDMFLVKYDLNGNVIWARTPTCSSHQDGDALALDTQGNIYIAGTFWGDMIIGSDTLTNEGITYEDIFAVKYDPNGNLVWSKKAGGPGRDWPNGIVVSPSNDVYVAGYFASDTMIFDSIALYNCDTSNYYNHDVFIAKLSQPYNGMEGLTANLDLRIYPNPANDRVSIEVNDHTEATVALINLLGTKVREIKVDDPPAQLSVADLAPGIYIIEYISQGRSSFAKLIVQQ
jgi:hypothetical protein